MGARVQAQSGAADDAVQGRLQGVLVRCGDGGVDGRPVRLRLCDEGVEVARQARLVPEVRRGWDGSACQEHAGGDGRHGGVHAGEGSRRHAASTAAVWE